MIQVRTLGANDLTAADRPAAASVLAQPKRFALLVYLAIAAPRGFVRRDALLALFWPETDQSRGRNVLRQTVFQLRQSLGSDAIASRGDEELGTDSHIVQCDVTQFETALAAGRTAEALELYRGDFLVGFHVPDAAPEFEEWIQAQSRRLRGLAADGAWSLAIAEEQAGNPQRSSQWARRALSLDPLNQTRITDVMVLLGRIGDRAGALQEFQDYARRAEEDLGMEPDREVERLAASLRAAPVPRPAVTPPVIATVESAQTQAAQAQAAPAANAPVRSTRWKGRGVVLGIALIAAVIVGGWLLRGARVRSVEKSVVAIGSITDATGDTLNRASNVPADLLSTSLARLVGLQVIPVTRVYDLQSQLRAAGRAVTSTLAAAKQAGAGHLIEGTLHRVGGNRMQMDLQVIDARTGSVLRAYRAQGNDLFSAVDDATAQIAREYHVSVPIGGTAEVTTSSLVAYRFYDEGLQAYYQDDFSAASRLFQAALEEDSTFVMAAYYAGITMNPAANDRVIELLTRAARLSDRVPERERFMIQAFVEALGYATSVQSPADSLIARYPLDPNAHYAMGVVWERRGDFMSAAREFRRVISMDSLSLLRGARCLACDAYEKLWWSYLHADSTAAAERVAREYAAARPASGRALGLLAAALDRRDRPEQALAALRALDSLRGGPVNYDLITAQAAIRQGDFATADSRLQRLQREGSPQLRAQAGWYSGISLRNQGRLREALQLTENIPNHVGRAITLFEMGRPAEAARAFEAQIGPNVTELPGGTARRYAWLLTHTSTSLAAAHDSTRLSALADSVERLGQRSNFGRDLGLHHYIRGLLWNERGQHARAADAFRQSIWSWSEGYTRANYELSRTLLQLEQPAQAVYPLQSALRGDLEASNLYITRTDLHEQLARAFDALGQRDSATAHYRQVVKAWERADPAFNARRNAAQLRLKALTESSPQTAFAR